MTAIVFNAKMTAVVIHSKSKPVNSKETGTIPASRILKPLWRLTFRSFPVLLNDKALQHSCVFTIHGCPQRLQVWLHPIIRQVLWRYRSSLYRVHWSKHFGGHLGTWKMAAKFKMAGGGANGPGGSWAKMYNILSIFISRIKILTWILTKLIL